MDDRGARGVTRAYKGNHGEVSEGDGGGGVRVYVCVCVCTCEGECV